MAGKLAEQVIRQFEGDEPGERSVTVTIRGSAVGVLDRYRKGKSYREVVETLILVAAEHLEEVRASKEAENEVATSKEG